MKTGNQAKTLKTQPKNNMCDNLWLGVVKDSNKMLFLGQNTQLKEFLFFNGFSTMIELGVYPPRSQRSQSLWAGSSAWIEHLPSKQGVKCSNPFRLVPLKTVNP